MLAGLVWFGGGFFWMVKIGRAGGGGSNNTDISIQPALLGYQILKYVEYEYMPFDLLKNATIIPIYGPPKNVNPNETAIVICIYTLDLIYICMSYIFSFSQTVFFLFAKKS
jgi:hypothetical protein